MRWGRVGGSPLPPRCGASGQRRGREGFIVRLVDDGSHGGEIWRPLKAVVRR